MNLIEVILMEKKQTKMYKTKFISTAPSHLDCKQLTHLTKNVLCVFLFNVFFFVIAISLVRSA